MNQFTIQEPRTTTRLLYGAAIRTAITDGERADLLAALQWYEMKWQAQDAQIAANRREKIENRAEADSGLSPISSPPISSPSAVELHGHDSPEAQAKRDERAAKRLAAEAAKQEGEAGKGKPDGDGAEAEPKAE